MNPTRQKVAERGSHIGQRNLKGGSNKFREKRARKRGPGGSGRFTKRGNKGSKIVEKVYRQMRKKLRRGAGESFAGSKAEKNISATDGSEKINLKIPERQRETRGPEKNLMGNKSHLTRGNEALTTC